MQIPLLDTLNAGNGRLMAADKNDRYVLKHCLVYLQRHLKRFPSCSRETCKMLVWTLGQDTERLVDFLTDHYERKQGQNFRKELMESDLDVDDYADFIAKLLPGIRGRSRRKIFQRIQDLLGSRQRSVSFRGRADFEKNIKAVERMLSLAREETEFITLLFIISIYEQPQEFFVSHLECQKIIGQKYLTNILGINRTQIHKLMTGKLKKIGILDIDTYDLKIEDEFLTLFQNPNDKKFSQNFYFKIKPGSVPLGNYFFKKEQIDHVLKLLQEKTDTSTHILLYGPPGTGKTSFAYSLKKHLKDPAYEIVRGDENTASKRRAAILACLNLTNTGDGSLIVVDEADNILNTQNSWLSRGETQDKGWLNQLLETPGIRIIWITNSIAGIEDSVLRRFAFSLHFKMFNRRQRVELWNNILVQNKCKRFFTPADIEASAKRYNLSAGVIDLAVKKSKETSSDSQTDFHQTVEMALEAHDTLRHFGEKPVNKDRIENKYSLEGLNVKVDLEGLIGQLKAFDKYLRNTETDTVINMNLLFYGPPGTGKSELARYIGNRLDREILCKRVSDLKSMWVGEGEKNIKRAFEEAESEEAILIIDEADSLLFNRNRAVRSWEISFTNEFLTRMERFRGILICTTNRVKDLDSASLRRLNHKIGFEYLTPEGNTIFYRLFLEPLSCEPLDHADNGKINRLANLAPGDFKVVRDRYLNKIHNMSLPLEANWEVAYEACFYRDLWYHQKKNGKLFSKKRTFDLCLLSDDTIIIIEAKSSQEFEENQLESFEKDKTQLKLETNVKTVLLVGLASSKYEIPPGIHRKTFNGPCLTWFELAGLYGNDKILCRADKIFEFGSNRSYGRHNKGGHKTGIELVESYKGGDSFFVGRSGGLHGKILSEDITSGSWRQHRYETNNEVSNAPNENWFHLIDFIKHIGDI